MQLFVLFGKNTVERQRTISTSSMTVKNATDEIKSAKYRKEKMKAIENYNNMLARENEQDQINAHQNKGYQYSGYDKR